VSGPPGPVEGLTIVVMTKDGWSELQKSLPKHRAPVILVDNGSLDGTPDRVRKSFPDVTVVELPRNHGAAARNIGVELADTDVVAFADDDSWWEPGSLELAVELFNSHPRLGLMAGHVLVGDDARSDAVCELMENSPLPRHPDLPGPSILGFLACGAVVRRRAFLAAGGFDDVIFFFGEEERLALDMARQGWGLAYVEDVVAHHHPVPSPSHVGREVLAARNSFLTAVLRRPWPVVLATARDLLSSGRTGRKAFAAALPRIPRALRKRRQIPVDVEFMRRMLDVA
jgi:glycosyltransferase involved in cell wall biosynthesis